MRRIVAGTSIAPSPEMAPPRATPNALATRSTVSVVVVSSRLKPTAAVVDATQVDAEVGGSGDHARRVDTVDVTVSNDVS